MTAIASRAQLRMSLLRYALVTVPMVLLLGTIAAQVAGTGSGNRWFAALAKPGFMPPAWAFGAAWPLFHILLGVALAMLLHARGARWRSIAITVFLLQLLANLLWPISLFSFHQIGWSLALLGLMISLTVVLIVLLWWIRRVAALLMLAWLAWLGFAAVLTISIWTLNPDAAEVAPQPASADIVL